MGAARRVRSRPRRDLVPSPVSSAIATDCGAEWPYPALDSGVVIGKPTELLLGAQEITKAAWGRSESWLCRPSLM
jgi:hypothetical protein